MKKLKLVVTTLCLVATLAFAVPTTTVYATGPQGTGNSAPKPPPPPPPNWTALFWALIRIL
jgi:quinol-cytochrome oxidoreductase complex cytochrome b subunit